MTKYIPLKHLPAEISDKVEDSRPESGGAFKYIYVPPSEEDLRWTIDETLKQKLNAERLKLADKFEEFVGQWAEKVLSNEGNINGLSGAYDRALDEPVVAPLKQNWVEMDKVVRFPTHYHRVGVITGPGNGNVDWKKIKPVN